MVPEGVEVRYAYECLRLQVLAGSGSLALSGRLDSYRKLFRLARPVVERHEISRPSVFKNTTLNPISLDTRSNGKDVAGTIWTLLIATFYRWVAARKHRLSPKLTTYHAGISQDLIGIIESDGFLIEFPRNLENHLGEKT